MASRPPLTSKSQDRYDAPMSDFDDIERMVELMDAHGLEEFELEQEGRRVRLRKHSHSVTAATGGDQTAHTAPVPESPPVTPPAAADDEGLVIVKSPIVGTFYRSPDPDAASFVDVGSSVRRGQVLCIIEAMKLMNEIDAEESGEVVSIFVENGQPVQYGEKLFAIKPATGQ